MTNTTRRGFLGWLGAALVLRKAALPEAPPLPPVVRAGGHAAAIHRAAVQRHQTDALKAAWRNAQCQILAQYRTTAPEWLPLTITEAREMERTIAAYQRRRGATEEHHA